MDKVLQQVELNKEKSYQKGVYDAVFLKEDGQVIDRLTHYDSNRLISKAVLLLERQYPDAICRIKDKTRNIILSELKMRHHYE